MSRIYVMQSMKSVLPTKSESLTIDHLKRFPSGTTLAFVKKKLHIEVYIHTGVLLKTRRGDLAVIHHNGGGWMICHISII